MSRYQLFPALAPATEAALIASIQRFGVLVPVAKDQHGNILDGHHRSRIAESLGIEYRCDIHVVADEAEAAAIVETLNVDRGHRLRADMAREQVAFLRSEGHSVRATADALGVPKSTVQDYSRQLSESGQLDIPDRTIGLDGKGRPARRAVITARNKQEEARANRALALVEPDGALSVQDVERAANRVHRANVATLPVVVPTGLYQTIVVDPPWLMEKIERETHPEQVGFDYPGMTEVELAAIELPAADDCHLYLWTTHKHLPSALRLVEVWGFRYQCLMTWRKNVGFTPFSWMYSTEHVLFCRRGNLPLLQMGLRLDFEAKRREHSRKPDEFYDLVRLASPGPRLDMFSREAREGFDQHGKETNLFAERVRP